MTFINLFLVPALPTMIYYMLKKEDIISSLEAKSA